MVYGILIHTIEPNNFNNNTIYLSQFYTSEGNNKDFQKRQNSILSKVIKDFSFKYQCENLKSQTDFEKQYPDWVNLYSGVSGSGGAGSSASVGMSSVGGGGLIDNITKVTTAEQQLLSQQQQQQQIISSKEGIFRILVKSKPPSLSLLLNTNLNSESDQFNDPSYYISSPKYVIWKRLLGVCFTIICEEDENRLLVSNFLNIFSNICNDHFKSTLSKATPQDIFPKTDELLVLLNSYLPNGQLLFISNQFSKYIKTTIPNSLSS